MSHREDVADTVDDFIRIAEVEMFQAEDAQLRIRQMIVTDTGATSDSVNTQALPTDYLEIISLKITYDTRAIPLDFDTLNSTVVRDGAGRPSIYMLTSQIEYDIIPDLAYVTNFTYYGIPTALSASNTTNAILTKYPNIYLYGALWALNQFANDTEEEQKYYAKFIKAIGGANAADAAGSFGASSQRKPRGRNP